MKRFYLTARRHRNWWCRPTAAHGKYEEQITLASFQEILGGGVWVI